MEKITTKSPRFPERQFILLSGIPGSGKTSLGNYLSKEHGFYFFETDSNWTEFMRELDLGVEDFVARWLNRSDHLCLEWGFEPSNLRYVLSFKNQGASIFWLTSDKHIARSNYLKANPNDPKGECWDIQFRKIEDTGLPTSDFVIIETYHDGNPIPFEELIPKILSKSGYGFTVNELPCSPSHLLSISDRTKSSTVK